MQTSILNRVIGGVFLIAGTSIGAGVIGLPLKTMGVSFYLLLFGFFITWIVMIISAVAMLEISSWSKTDINIVRIYYRILGKKFSYFICIILLLFLYSLMTAYISGGSTMLIDIINVNLNNNLYNFFFSLIFIIPFSVIVFFGIKTIDYINRIFVFILVILYLLLLYKIYNTFNISINYNVNFSKVSYTEFKLLLFSLPLIVTSFGYHLLIPSLNLYLQSQIKLLYIVIILGSFIPFIVYLVWEYFIISMLINVYDNLSIQILYGYGNPIEKLIILISNNNNFILYIIILFSFFSLSSSLIGVSLGLFDFFLDLFGLSRSSIKNKMFVLCLTFFIPVIFNILFPYIFMKALGFAGIFASILLILVPTGVLWYGRYIKNINSPYILFGGKITIYIAIFFGIFIIFIELFEQYF